MPSRGGQQAGADAFVAVFPSGGGGALTPGGGVWAELVGFTGQERARAVAVDGAQNIHVTGQFTGKVRLRSRVQLVFRPPATRVCGSRACAVPVEASLDPQTFELIPSSTWIWSGPRASTLNH